MFEFPLEVKVFLVVFITGGIKAILGLLGVNITGWVDVVVGGLVASILAFATTLVGALTPELQNFIVGVLTLVAGLGVFRLVRRATGTVGVSAKAGIDKDVL